MRASNIDGSVTGVQGSLTGNSLTGTGSQSEASVRNELVALRECRADLQVFLQRTRTRLSTIANTTIECCDYLVEDSDSSRVLRDAGSSQELKPGPALSSVVHRRGRALAAETACTSERQHAGAKLPADSTPRHFVPFVSSPAYQKRGESRECAVLRSRSKTDGKYPMLEDSGPDWKVANAFDRNSYYGPTDFVQVPDELECSIPANLCSNVANDRIDAFCKGIPQNQFGTRQVQSGRAQKTSKLHLANQIRQN